MVGRVMFGQGWGCIILEMTFALNQRCSASCLLCPLRQPVNSSSPVPFSPNVPVWWCLSAMQVTPCVSCWWVSVSMIHAFYEILLLCLIFEDRYRNEGWSVPCGEMHAQDAIMEASPQPQPNQTLSKDNTSRILARLWITMTGNTLNLVVCFFLKVSSAISASIFSHLTPWIDPNRISNSAIRESQRHNVEIISIIRMDSLPL